ncbi:MAG TPA: DUF669 domain-containing protein [Lachnospiraceae bacterium]|nr:DUF669 domain-containing protein [Lachnospiraceae bacterium]
MSAENTGRELGWDDVIEKDNQFILLPEGDYDFTVESFDRARHNGSDGIPACSKAVLKIRIDAPEGRVIVTHNLYLHSNMEWKLSEFFTSIGQKKKGEALRMNWNMVPGATGRLKLSIRTYNEKDYNNIKQFYPKDESAAKFTPGKF